MNDSQIVPSNQVKPAFVPNRSKGNSLNGVARQARRGKGIEGGVSAANAKVRKPTEVAPSFVGIAG
ncbi:MAG TPA: hypothetical protein DE179_03275 [Oceanospirillaceae bacterium]|nr:hypothetical protein [Oceanospirillaceae bacterium]